MRHSQSITIHSRYFANGRYSSLHAISLSSHGERTGKDPQFAVVAQLVARGLSRKNPPFEYGGITTNPYECLFIGVAIEAELLRDSLIPRVCRASLLMPVRQQLREQLCADLADLCAGVLHGYYNCWREITRVTSSVEATQVDEYFDHMNTIGWETVFERFPVLYRLVISLTRDWAVHTAEVLSAAENDKAMLGGAGIAGLLSISVPMSDRHRKGRTVRALHFSDGKKYIYKPRDLGLEVAWNEFLIDFEKYIGELCPRRLHVLEGNGYGWVEQIQHRECSYMNEVRAFYKKAGVLCALAYFLNSRDLHYENIIAVRDDPFVVDPETIISATNAPPTCTSQACFRLYDFSASGLLRCNHSRRSGELAQIGGFDECVNNIAHTSLCYANNSHGGILAQNTSVTRLAANLPRYDGRQQVPRDFLDDLLYGFNACCLSVLRNKASLLESVVDKFADCRTRVVLLSTPSYRALIGSILASPALSNSAQFDKCLNAAGKAAIDSIDCVLHSNYTQTILRDISCLDIPRQWQHISKTVMECDDGATIGEMPGKSAIETVKHRIMTFSGAKLPSLRKDIETLVRGSPSSTT